VQVPGYLGSKKYTAPGLYNRRRAGGVLKPRPRPISFKVQTLSPAHESMTSARRLHFKTFLMILVMVIAGPLGNVLLGKGMKHVGKVAVWPPDALISLGLRIFSSGTIWLGVASLITFFLAYMLVLSWADYSYVQPASSFAYAVVALLSYLLLGEAVSPLRWAGIGVICLGVFVVGRTNPQSSSRARAQAGEPV
jgi:uncharacterized membrane protein